jgi:hypothetical protein
MWLDVGVSDQHDKPEIPYDEDFDDPLLRDVEITWTQTSVDGRWGIMRSWTSVQFPTRGITTSDVTREAARHYAIASGLTMEFGNLTRTHMWWVPPDGYTTLSLDEGS